IPVYLYPEIRHRHSYPWAITFGPIKTSNADFLAIIRTFMASSEILGGGPNDDFIDFHIRRLLDGVSNRARDRISRNSLRRLVELAQVVPGRFVRAAFRKLRGNSTRRDYRATNVFGM